MNPVPVIGVDKFADPVGEGPGEHASLLSDLQLRRKRQHPARVSQRFKRFDHTVGNRHRLVHCHYQTSDAERAINRTPSLKRQAKANEEIPREKWCPHGPKTPRMPYGLLVGRKKRPIALKLELLGSAELPVRQCVHGVPAVLAARTRATCFPHAVREFTQPYAAPRI